MGPQVGANGLPRSEAHLHRDPAPASFPADRVEATLLVHQLPSRAEEEHMVRGLGHTQPSIIHSFISMTCGVFWTVRDRVRPGTGTYPVEQVQV